ncbi:hypothetical protein GJ688_16275 [Heliobacillus mobilis]|uniref:Uncharacterized protein n=1 Tax=Heliobacterium mobile TaxID=28064 RepID=A0A6I3SNA3_HELMO|nr:hypothetical protein [Heliobacterium mobile]MTV50503.1 hypothetical protein [Heliobacterium mobile]
MTDEIHKLYTTEIREKKAAATGVHHKKGRRGLVGAMITPADLAGKEYKSPGTLQEFHVDDLVSRLESSPILKTLILDRMDDQYRQYRQATEQTLDLLTDILAESLKRFEKEAESLRQRIACLENSQRTDSLSLNKPPYPVPLNWNPNKRIRWGSTPEEIKAAVFRQLQRLQANGNPICVETIKSEVPGMLRWLYGEKAVFNGLKGLQQEYRRQMERYSSADDYDQVEMQ